MNLSSYRTLGRSGLVVSPLALGTMTFGAERWGSNADTSRAIFDAYADAGGNFVDTADVYSGGGSEEMLGRFVADRALRDRMVIATKAGFPSETGHPHVGGNGAKHIRSALEGSLRRLGTDHVDLFWVHVWDQVTPVEEVLSTLVDLVRSGKIRYYGLSNVPAWYAAAMATLAAARGVPGPIALQFHYSLVERAVEHEHLVVARELGMAMVPWSPLGGGFLTGKYDRADAERAGNAPPSLPSGAAHADAVRSDDDNRLSGGNPFGDSKFTEENWRILDAVKAVAGELSVHPAHVALAWVVRCACVGSVLIGASRPEQVADNIASLDVTLTPEQVERLDAVSAPAPYFFGLFTPPLRRMIFGGTDVVASHDM